jgi:hypothetical protein
MPVKTQVVLEPAAQALADARFTPPFLFDPGRDVHDFMLRAALGTAA